MNATKQRKDWRKGSGWPQWPAPLILMSVAFIEEVAEMRPPLTSAARRRAVELLELVPVVAGEGLGCLPPKLRRSMQEAIHLLGLLAPADFARPARLTPGDIERLAHELVQELTGQGHPALVADAQAPDLGQGKRHRHGAKRAGE